MRVLCLWFAVCQVYLGAASAESIDPRAEAAHEHYRSGLRHYQHQEYCQAIVDYNQAYALAPAAILFFDLGQAYRLRKDYTNAIAAYHRYLALLPDAPNSEEVEAWVDQLEDRLNWKLDRGGLAPLAACPPVPGADALAPGTRGGSPGSQPAARDGQGNRR